MNTFSVKLADICIGVSVQLPSTKIFLRSYCTQAAPHFSVSVSKTDIERERKRANEEYSLADRPAQGFPEYYLERQFLLREISEKIPAYDAMLVHGSAVTVDGKAYIFTAPSGTGKSTHSRLWRELLGDRAVMINDDKPFLRLQGGVFHAYGSPWRGKHDLGENISAPLAGICILSQAPKNSIKQLAPADALHAMLQQCYKPTDADSVLRTLTMIDRLLAQVPVYHLACNMDISAAELSYNTIVK